MDRNTKTDPNPPQKYGKFLAVGMAVALIWSIVLLIVGIVIKFKFGSILTNLAGDVDSVVKVKSAQNAQGQNIVPLSSTISDDVDFGAWPTTLAALVILLALASILFACLGIYGGLKHSKFVLYITIVFLLLSALLLVVLIAVSANSDSQYHDDAKDQFVDILKSKYKVETSDEAFVLALNRIMLWFECCGVRNYEEFTNLTFLEIKPDSTTVKFVFKVAPACCVRSFFNSETSGVSPFDKLKECALKGNDIKGNIHTKGCYDELFNAVNGPATIMFILILLWDILMLILVILTIMETKPEEEGGEAAPEAKKEELEEAPPVKKFVPYAKISSFVHPDLSRIKSTEIW